MAKIDGNLFRVKIGTVAIGGTTSCSFQISKDLQEMIFTRFYQPGEKVDNLSSSKFRFKGSGLGLGLALSRAIVKAHGGRIWAVSDGYDEAKLPGTSFHLFFPFQRQNMYPEG